MTPVAGNLASYLVKKTILRVKSTFKIAQLIVENVFVDSLADS